MIEPTVATLDQLRLARYATLRRKATASLCALSLMLQQACYNKIPVAGASTMPDGPVTLTVNDRGRVLVGSKLGPLLDHVDGRITRADSVNVEVAVETAEDVRGNLARWGGERFTIPREGIETVTTRKVSKSRTALIVGGVLGVIIAAFVAIKPGKNKNGGEGPGTCCDPL